MGTASAYARCPTCYVDFSEAEISGKSACPRCGSTALPLDPSNDVTIRINWGELRMLAIWAENWTSRFPDDQISRDCKQAMLATFARLRPQAPDGAAPLSLSDEFKQLKQAYGENNVEVWRDGKRIDSEDEEPTYDPTVPEDAT